MMRFLLWVGVWVACAVTTLYMTVTENWDAAVGFALVAAWPAIRAGQLFDDLRSLRRWR